MKQKKQLVKKTVKAFSREAISMADAIADFAEPGFREFKSSKLLASFLKDNGFKVTFPWKYNPTAFRADWGSKHPSIGLLAEYDALPDCGPEKGQWGHGCGHNLLGTAAVLGAVSAKQILEEQGIKAGVTLWGTPAEEIMLGKVIMARDGAFRDNDAILGWHPSTVTRLGGKGGAAMDSLLFEFFGKTAHGATAHHGRSALDAVMLMDSAVNYLREHVPDNVRIHMCVPEGGEFPNVVPEYASAWYYVRGVDRAQVDEVAGRVITCAKGAALQTETRVKRTRLTGAYSRCENDGMADAVYENMKIFKNTKVTAADKKAVEKLGIKPEFNTELQIEDKAIHASSDEDNVSWLAPFGRFSTACLTTTATAHHRTYASQMKLPFAHRGMIMAGEIFAGTLLDLVTKPELLKKAKAEFRKRTRGFTYDPLITRTHKPSVFDKLVKY